MSRSDGTIRHACLLPGLILAVCIVVLVVWWPALSTRALLFDDQQYLVDNSLVRNPSWASAGRFLGEGLHPSTVEGYYQPLAMISLMLDCAMGGRPDNLRPFHRTSLALHVANTGLVILLIHQLFGRAWVGAGVGLLFGVHPMWVESLCWVGDRKTLLAALFALACLVLYVRYARRRARRAYIGCLIAFVLALLSKPTSTPLPLVMLLMDGWPLGRWGRRAVVEKLPFFAIAGVSAVVTYLSQSATAGVDLPGETGPWRVPLILCHNIVFYLRNLAWPANLSPHYAFPKWPWMSDPMMVAGVIGSVVLIGLLVVSLRWTRAAMAGWLIFFVAILPTMGVIGFADAIAADRFAYLPAVGLLMVAAWGLGRLQGPRGSVAAVLAVLTVAGAEAVAARRYLAHWRDTMSLCDHMVARTPDAAPVHKLLGIANASQGRMDEAAGHFRRALKIAPDSETRANLAGVLLAQGRIDEALGHLLRVRKERPGLAKARYNLGLAWASQGKLDDAIAEYRAALNVNPDLASAHRSLGAALLTQGKTAEAAGHFDHVLRLRGGSAEALTDVGNILLRQGKIEEAIGHYRRALELAPDLVAARSNLAGALLSQGKTEEAIALYQRVIELQPDTQAYCDLGTALAAANRTEEAVACYGRALELAVAAGDEVQAAGIRERLEQYRR